MGEASAPLARLTTIEATDGLQLPALIYEPQEQDQSLSARPAKPAAPTQRHEPATRRAVIWLHGMGSSGIFYNPVHTNALAAAFTRTGTAFIGLQNRGGGLLQGIKYFDETGAKQKRLQGTSHELIADCVHDIDGAVAFARAQGYTELYLGGHSTGANKVALYSYLKSAAATKPAADSKPRADHNPFAGYVLYGGGDDTGLFYEDLGPERFQAALAEARRQVKAGHGADLAPFETMNDHFSYQSIADILDPDGHYNTSPFYEAHTGHRLGAKPLWREYKSITKPTLVVYGAQDEYCRPDVPTVMALLKRECPDPANFTFATIPGGDHGSFRYEPELARTIAEWVAN